MPHLITTTKLQQQIGKISHSIQEQSYIVTNHGEGKIVLLPYFEGCDEPISDYMEDFEMSQNASALRKQYRQSAHSGKSHLVV